MTKKHVVTGRVIAAQEDRLRIALESGENLLLTLGRFTRLPASLLDLERSQARVQVTYTGEPNLTSGIIHHIKLV